MNNNKYKPLIKLNHAQQQIYLPLTHYSLPEILKLKKHLPKSLTLAGVDTVQASSREDRLQLQKQKIKVKAISGYSTTANQQPRFYQPQHLQLTIWHNVFLCINLPYNSKQDPLLEKQEIDSKLTNYLQQYLIFRNTKTGQFYNQSSNASVNIEDLDLFLEAQNVRPESFDTHYRQIRFAVPVLAIFQKKQQYSLKQIYEAVEQDLLSSIKILIKNKLTVRILESNSQCLVLQTYIKSLDDRHTEENKLASLLNNSNLSLQQPPTQQQQNESQSSLSQQLMAHAPRRDLSHRSLVFILSGMFLLYVFLKINPLERLLSETL